MKKEISTAVSEICSSYGNDKGRLMDIIWEVMRAFGQVSDEAIELIAKAVSIPRVDVESTVTFYAFFSKEPKGNIVIRLCDDIIDRLAGVMTVAEAFERELGIKFGETTPDGKISLEFTPCIGMCDQAPAALVNDEVITYLSTDKVKSIVKVLRETGDPKRLTTRLGDGANANPLVHSMVHNSIIRKDQIIFADYEANSGLTKALSMSPVEVINEAKTARLRGRGGAGFPLGMKWEFTRGADGDEKYILCNADEGEPGTFKDRVLLTELADRVFEGMTIAGYAVGAQFGILYLRGEYAYIEDYLNDILKKRRESGLLGENSGGKAGFTFDIRVQLGAGAYICGEETSLISSCEGLRGDPKNRPPYPPESGYMGKPTAVNNVETFVAVCRVMDKGAGWFAGIGSKGSSGTKLLSVSGDCQSPGIYEVPFGTPVKQLLKDAGAEDAIAVQIGGPSGQMIAPDKYDRTICYDDLATGGSVMVFGPQRNILEVANYFMDFFVEESCGYCTPCRAGNVILKKYLQKVIDGNGEPEDIEIMKSLGATVKTASRCGLGQTSPNPILSTIENFMPEYEKLVKENTDGLQPDFDIQAVLSESKTITGRESVIFK